MDEKPMMIFSTDLHHPMNQLSFENQKFMIAITMYQFREIPMCSGGYDEEGLRFYDGILGNLIRMRDIVVERELYDVIDGYTDFLSSWEYQGDIYRVLDKSLVYPKNKEPYYRTPSIKWHGMIASWSSSYDFTENFNHIYADKPYTIIHANTGKSAGIDANKFGEYLGYHSRYTIGENEIIFPMKKEFVVNVYKNITPNEFKKMMESKVK